MKIIKKEDKDFQIGQIVRVRKYEEIREIYDKVSMSSLPKHIYGNIYTIKDIKKIGETAELPIQLHHSTGAFA